MNNKKTVKSSDSSPKNSVTRLKKLPPPPLCLPASNAIIDEEKLSTSNQQYEQNVSTNNCCLSSSSKECPHEHIPYVSGKKFIVFFISEFLFYQVLPMGQRSQILETLITSSSKLLVPSSSETKQRKSQASINSNQTNLLQ
jgi:hypothetical protein